MLMPLQRKRQREPVWLKEIVYHLQQTERCHDTLPQVQLFGSEEI